MAGQTDLVEAFRNKEDVYKLMASSIYRVPVAEVSTSQRQVGKVVILGCGYGVGPAKLRITVKAMAGVDISAGEAKRIIDAYRTTYAMIPKLWAKAQEALIALSQGTKHVIDVQGLCTTDAIGITLPSGLHIQYPELRKAFVEGKSEWNYKSKGLITRIYGGAIIENCCQAVARCIIGEQMTRVAKKYTVVMTVHDSIGIIAPVAEAKEAQQFLEECMRWAPKWAGDLPLNCESGMGTSYGDC
jgi:DNA polymerase